MELVIYIALGIILAFVVMKVIGFVAHETIDMVGFHMRQREYHARQRALKGTRQGE